MRNRTEKSIGTGDSEVESEVPAPGVADRPRSLDTQAVENGDRVGDMLLDRERAAAGGGR